MNYEIIYEADDCCVLKIEGITRGFDCPVDEAWEKYLAMEEYKFNLELLDSLYQELKRCRSSIPRLEEKITKMEKEMNITHCFHDVHIEGRDIVFVEEPF